MSDTAQDSRAIMNEMKTKAFMTELETQNGPLYERIEATAQAVESASIDEIHNSEELKIIRNCAQSIKTAQMKYREEAAKIDQQTRTLTPEGRIDAKRQKAAERDAEIARARALAEAYVPKLTERFRGAERQSPSPEIAAEAQLIISRYSQMAASSFMREASEALRKASDPATPPEARARWEQLLINAYQPLIERRAENPEKHAVSLASSAERLNEAIRNHLGTSNKPSIAAQDLALQITQSFSYIEKQLASDVYRSFAPSATDDHFDLIEIANPVLFPDNGTQWFSKNKVDQNA
jgi:hypothetical protein